MAIGNIAERAAQRRKWIAAAVIGAFSLTAAVVALTFWRARTRLENQRNVPQPLPHNVHQQLSGYSITRSEEGRQIFTVRAARTLALKKGGTTVLENVSVEFFGREGNRHDILRTGQCEYHPDSGDIISSGAVEIELNSPRQVRGATPEARREPPPIFLKTSQVSFRQKGSMLATDQPVHFRIGTASGTAKGMTYATKEGWMELNKDIRLEWFPAAKGSDSLPVRLQAVSLRYASLRGPVPDGTGRDEAPNRPEQGEGGKAIVAGPVEIVQGRRRVSADRASIFLDARDQVTGAVIEGRVHAAESSGNSEATVEAERVRAEFDPSSGQLKTVFAEGAVAAEARSKGRQSSVSRLAAEQVEVRFRGAHPMPQNGRAAGNARLALDSLEAPPSGAGAQKPGEAGPVPPRGTGAGLTAQAGATERRTLAASEIDFDFRPGRWDLKEIRTSGAGELYVLPSDPRAGERIISAGQLVIGFERGRLVKMLSGFSGTHVVFKPAPSAPPATPVRESFSRTLEAVFNPETRAVTEMSQTGDFRLINGDRRATAERARYTSSTQVFELEGRPRIEDDESRVSADRIVYDLRNDEAIALGHVQSVRWPGSAGVSPPTPAGGGGNAAPMTSPTHVLADRMVAQKRSQSAHYEGRVRAWHGSTLIESAWLDIDRVARRMSAGGPVSTSSLQSESTGQGADKPSVAQRSSQPVLIRADGLEVVDNGARATYRGRVQFQTENTVLDADRADVFFSKAKAGDPTGIERARAEGHVRVAQPGRRATGERADYDSAAGKIVLSGGPPVLEDAEKGSTTGLRLTFFIHDDRLLVDGDAKSPVVSTHRIAQ